MFYFSRRLVVFLTNVRRFQSKVTPFVVYVEPVIFEVCGNTSWSGTNKVCTNILQISLSIFNFGFTSFQQCTLILVKIRLHFSIQSRTKLLNNVMDFFFVYAFAVFWFSCRRLLPLTRETDNGCEPHEESGCSTLSAQSLSDIVTFVMETSFFLRYS